MRESGWRTGIERRWIMRSGCGGMSEKSGGLRGGVRSVKAGEVVLHSTPFAHIIDAPYISMYCDACLIHHRECLLRPCKGCRVVWYCSEGCQEEALAWHRLECHALRRRQHHLPQDFVRLLARVILRLRNGGDKHVEKYSEKEGRRFRDLMSHYADIKNNTKMTEDAEWQRKEVGKLIGERLLPNPTDFLGIYGRILVNRFSLFEKTLLNIGSAIYLAASIFDHQCLPNCHIAFSGRTVEIRTLVDMPRFDFNKCRIAYVDPVSTVASRRQNLHDKWLFWCDCKTCQDEDRRMLENSIICDNLECLAPVGLQDIETNEEEKKGGLKEKKDKQKNGVSNSEAKDEEEKNEENLSKSQIYKRNYTYFKGKENERLIQDGRNGMEVDKITKNDEYENMKVCPKNTDKRKTGISVKREKENVTKVASTNYTLSLKKDEDEDEEDEEDEEEEEEEEKKEEKESKCEICGRQVSEDRKKKYWEAVSFTREKLRNMTEEDPDMEFCLEMMERQEGLFSHLNAWRVRTYDFAFNAAMFRGCWSLALTYGEENQDGMRFYYGSENPIYCLFLYKLGKAKIYFKEFRQGVKLLEEAEKNLKVALGDSHPLLEDLRLINLMANEDVEICLERRIAAAKKKEEERKECGNELPHKYECVLPQGYKTGLPHRYERPLKQGEGIRSLQEGIRSLQEGIRSLQGEGIRSLQGEGIRSLQGEGIRSPQGEGIRSLQEGIRSPQGEGIRSPQGEGIRSLKEGIRSPHGEGIRSPHGEGIRSPHGEGIRSPHGEGIRSPHGEGIRSPHGDDCVLGQGYENSPPPRGEFFSSHKTVPWLSIEKDRYRSPS